MVFFGVIRIGGASTQQSAHDDSHSSHESTAFGHASVYSMEAGVSNIIAIAGAEDHFAFMVVPTTTASSEGLEEAEEAAESGEIFVDFLLFFATHSFVLLYLPCTSRCFGQAPGTTAVGTKCNGMRQRKGT